MNNSTLPENQDLSEMSLISLTERLANSGELARARVIIPNDEELKITLVDINTIRKLYDLKNDETFLSNCLFTVLGVLLSAIVAILTANKRLLDIDDKWLIVIVFLILILIFINFLRMKISKRSNAIRKKIFKENE
jgi:hypothetical protein